MLPWPFNKIIEVCIYPITFFWKELFFKAKKSDSIIKLILFFVLSFGGTASIIYALIWLLCYVFTYHMDIVIVISVIIWLFAYVRAQIIQVEQKNEQEQEEQNALLLQEKSELENKARQAYPLVRNIMYQILKSSAEYIGGLSPRLLSEIEVPETHWIISNGLCFYQFKSEKADTRIQYSNEELKEFVTILNYNISRKLDAHEFPTLGVQKYIDEWSNVHSALQCDIIEDLDRYLLIQVILYSPEYAKYLHDKQLALQGENLDTIIPDEEWGSSK